MDSSVSSKKMGPESPDNRFPLSFYVRIANQILNLAKVYREEKNIYDLYTILNRYTSLVSEVISQHPSYSTYSAKEKLRHKQILEQVVKEVEDLKPLVGTKFDEINRAQSQKPDNNGDISHLVSQRQSVHSHGTLEDTIHRRGCSMTHTSTVESISMQRFISPEDNAFVSVITDDCTTNSSPIEFPCSTSTTSRGCDIDSRPSPAISCIQRVPNGTHVSHVNDADSINGHPTSSLDKSRVSKALHDLHIPARLMEDFMELAKANTDKNLETCGVLGAVLKNGTFYVTTLIIPKQESTSDSCQTEQEEEIYAIQEEQNLLPVGWIHTHPSQTCFMSSIDLHTHFSYQVMLAEAIAIVMAPTDTSRTNGIFRLSDPGGIAVLKDCPERGFHHHQEPSDGTPVYEDCANVYMNSNLRFEIIDLR